MAVEHLQEAVKGKEFLPGFYKHLLESWSKPDGGQQGIEDWIREARKGQNPHFELARTILDQAMTDYLRGVMKGIIEELPDAVDLLLKEEAEE